VASRQASWQAAARLPLSLFAAVMAAAALSYAIDLSMFGHAADARLAPLDADAATAPRIAEMRPSASPPGPRSATHIYFKWAAAPDYVRDVVVPDYGGERMTFAFYTFFHSNRRVVLYRPLTRKGEWIPFECAPVQRALLQARDDIDRRFLNFLGENYCVP
jgi:hypothetical protein